MACVWDDTPLPPKFFSALVIGGLAGGLLTPFWFALQLGDPEALDLFPFVAPVAALIWLIGLLFVGVPGWLVLHRLGLRNGLAAACLGVVALLPALLLDTAEPVRFAALSFVAMGPIVGWIVWLIAYGGKG